MPISYTLRDYQSEARIKCNSLINAKTNHVLVMPTGTGKTKTTVAIIADRVELGERVYVVVPQVEIFSQWISDLSESGLNPGYINDEGMRGANRGVYVCMALSLCNLLPHIPEHLYPNGIVTDECHHSGAVTWDKIYEFFPNAWREGLTATPVRDGGKQLGDIYDELFEAIEPECAVSRGFICKPVIIAPDEFKDLELPDDPDSMQGLAVQSKILGSTRIIGDIIQTYRNTLAGLPVLVACSTFDHADLICSMFNEAGFKFEHIHSGLSASERARMMSAIKQNKINGLATVGIGIEGLDIPGLYGLIWLRKTRSIRVYRQFIGRVLRRAPGKKYGLIIDPVGNVYYHGYPTRRVNWDLKKSNPEYEEDIPIVMKKCPECGVMNNKENKLCHFCGYDFSTVRDGLARSSKLRFVDGKLSLVSFDDIEALNELQAKAMQAKAEEDKIKETKPPDALESTREQKQDILKDLFKGRRSLFRDTMSGFIGGEE